MNVFIDSLDLAAAVIAIVFMTRAVWGSKEVSNTTILANSIKRSLMNQIVTPRM